MGKTINEHKISITLITAALCAVFLFQSGIYIGSAQAKIKDNVAANQKNIKEIQDDCKTAQNEQNKINKEVLKRLIEMQKDIEYIKKKSK